MWLTGLCAFLALVVAVVTWMVTRDPEEVALPADQAHVTLATGATQALATFVDAVAARDPQATATIAVEGPEVLVALVQTAARADVRDFSLRYVADNGGVRPDGSWSATVAATWSFAEFDQTPTRMEIDARLRQDGGDVKLVGFGGGDNPVPVWLSGPTQVRRTRDVLVIAAAGGQEATRMETLARRAVRVVRRVVPWRQGLVVEVPGAGGLDAALGVEPGEYDSIAAVTTSQDGSTAPDAPVHVFVNADLVNDLRPAGAQVVLSHEATHVATRAPGSRLPLWLLEGFADYVALRDVALPRDLTAARIRRQVRRDGLPDRLPGAAEFKPSSPNLEAAYESAWLAVVTVAEAVGERALVACYRSADAGTPVSRALADAGLSHAELRRRWLATLADLRR